MSSSTNGNEKHDDNSAYAPKWARDVNHAGSPSIAQGEFPPYSDQSVPQGALPAIRRTDIVRLIRLLEERNGLGAGLTDRSRRAEPANLPSSPPSGICCACVARWSLTSSKSHGLLGGLSGGLLPWVGSLGAATALLITGEFPSIWNKMFGVGADKAAFISRFQNASRVPGQPSSAAAGLAVGLAGPRIIDEGSGRVAGLGASKRAPTVRGVTDAEIRFGISAPFTGAAKQLGTQAPIRLTSS